MGRVYGLREGEECGGRRDGNEVLVWNFGRLGWDGGLEGRGMRWDDLGGCTMKVVG